MGCVSIFGDWNALFYNYFKWWLILQGELTQTIILCSVLGIVGAGRRETGKRKRILFLFIEMVVVQGQI